MKTERQTKAKPDSKKTRSPKKPKSSSGTDGNSPLVPYEHAPIGIVECSPDGRHLRVNEEFAHLLGYEKEELAGKDIKTITHEDDYPIDIKLHQQLVEGKIPFYRLEKRFLRKDGGILWVELTRTLVRDASGTPLYTIGVVLDISDRKQVERVLRESVERLRLATEAAGMFTWELDLNTRIYTFADNFEQVLGFSAGLLPKNSVESVERLSLPEDVQAFWEAVAQAIEHHSDLHSLQLRVIDPEGGQTVWLEINAKIIYDEAGKAKRILGVAQNITQRKRAEQTLREFGRQQEALYQLTDQLQLTNSPEDVFNAALNAIQSALQCDRASILLFDETNAIHFVAWRGLSDAYRQATDGHSPWKTDEKNPEPICMNEVDTADLSDSLRATVKEEGIGALAFIPLISNGKLIGKFMTYYNAPHVFDEAEVQLSMTIARQLASSIERKRAEAALARERELLNRLFETMPVMVSMYDPKTNSLRLNAEFERRIGWKTEEVSVSSLLELLYPDPEYRSQVIQRMSAAGRNDWVEVQVKTRDGRTLDSIWSNASILNDRQIGIGVDITARKRAEENLRTSEDRLRLAVSAGNIGIWDIDLVRRERTWSNEGKAIYGLAADEFLDLDRQLALTHPDDRELVTEMVTAFRDLGTLKQLNFEHRIIRPDGALRWVEVQGEAIYEGHDLPVRLIGTIVDITDRKRAEERLRQTASFDEAVMGSMGEGLYTVDSEGRVTSLNPAAEKMFGLTLEELRGRRMHDVTHYKHPDGTPFPAEDCAGYQVLHHGNKLIGHEDVFIRKDGTFFDVIYSSSPLWDNGKISGLVVVFSDNTIRKQSEKRLVLLSEISELIRKSEDANELLFAVSEAVGDHFQARRCLFNEIDVENDIEVVHHDYCRGVESVAGIHKVSDYSSVTSAEMAAGKTVVNHDSKTDPRTAPDYERSYVLNGERAYVTVPLMRENRWVASLWLSDDMPRQWSREDVSLLETIAERTWIAIEKLRINEALRASEGIYRTIARSIPGGGIYVVDKDMRYIVADGAVTESFGLSGEMLEGRTVSEVFRGEQRTRMIERLNQNFAGQTISYETEHNGRVYWTQQAPLTESVGEAIIVTLDITERKRMEEALRQSEERFVQFMEHLPGLAWIKDLQGQYIYTNAAAEKAFNASRQELYGKTDQEIFPSEVAAQFIKNDQQALSDGKGVQIIETLEQPDGVVHYSLVNKFPIPGLNGEITLIGGTALDITERKRAEEALQESEERLSALLRQATAGIVRKDSEGKLQFVNQAFCNMLGYTESELLGKTVWEFMDPEDVPENKRSFDRLMLEGIPFKLERRFLRPDGSIIWVDASVSPVMDATGRPQSAVAVEVDITARKQAEAALQQLNLQLETRVVMRTTELQEANAALQESRRRLQILSQRLVEVQEEERRAIARELHDRVGQSLSALNINLIIMRDQLLPDSLERVGPRLNDSMHLVGETITLVRDVMSNLRPSVLDDYGLEAALQSHIDEYMSRYEIKVVLERAPQPIPRLGSSIEMTFLRIAQEALMNIARHANASQVTLSIRQEGELICMTVQDNGSGIVSWQQAHRPGSHGLTIMRERAEAVGGSLEVASVPGEGTRVEMSIPIGKANQNEVPQETLE